MTTADPIEPVHIRLPPKLRSEAEYRRAGPNRDAILRLADELEATGDASLVSHATLRAGLCAIGNESDCLEDVNSQPSAGAGPAEFDAQRNRWSTSEPRAIEPVHVRLPPKLRHEAEYCPPGPDRDAILRLADELEATGDASLVSHATLRAGLHAIGADHDPAPAGWDADAAQ